MCVELLGVNARHQAARPAGGQNPPRLRYRERAAIAVDIAKFRESRRRDCGNPALHQQIHKRFGPAAIFRRNDVRAEKRPGDIERLLLMQLLKKVQNLQLALPIQAVAALGFERGGSVRRELPKMQSSALAQHIWQKRAGGF